MKVLSQNSDFTGCSYYRYRVPFIELKSKGVQSTPIYSVPVDYRDQFSNLCEFFSHYDLIHIQRCPKLETVHAVRDVCHILNKPLVFDTDDDYFNIEEHNPGFEAFGSKDQKEKFKEILRIVDMVTVSTQELKDLYYPYNKNIHVLPNNVEYIPSGEGTEPKRDIHQLIIKPDGTTNIGLKPGGIMLVPGYKKSSYSERDRIIRIGYTGSEHHKKDFDTIADSLGKILNKYHGKVIFVAIGNKYFFDRLKDYSKNAVHVPATTHHDQYLSHIRNLDIGLAPLERTLFNMSKSSIKAVEYGQWGIPAILPNYITYTREFTHNMNCLMYNNITEFEKSLEELINNESLRRELGKNARDFVKNNKLEQLHSQKRYDLYSSLVTSKRKILLFRGDKNDRS